jgi:hypothetical protein
MVISGDVIIPALWISWTNIFFGPFSLMISVRLNPAIRQNQGFKITGGNLYIFFRAQNAPVAGAMSMTGASYWIKD